jgi:hypothetical protein
MTGGALIRTNVASSKLVAEDDEDDAFRVSDNDSSCYFGNPESEKYPVPRLVAVYKQCSVP